MRVVFVSTVVFVLLLAGPVRAATFADSLASAAAAWSNDAEFGQLAAELTNRLPGLIQETNQTLMNASGLRIDIVLQHHFTTREGQFVEDPASATSQRRVFGLLVQKKYGMVGTEGDMIGRITMRSCFDFYLGIARSIRGDVDTSLVGQSIREMRANDAILQYADAYPKAVVVGVDDFDVTQLHDAVLTRIDTGGESLYGLDQLAELSLLLSRLRSQICLAHLVTQMRSSRVGRGCLVIGYMHEDELRRLSAKHHIIGAFIDTTR